MILCSWMHTIRSWSRCERAWQKYLYRINEALFDVAVCRTRGVTYSSERRGCSMCIRMTLSLPRPLASLLCCLSLSYQAYRFMTIHLHQWSSGFKNPRLWQAGVAPLKGALFVDCRRWGQEVEYLLKYMCVWVFIIDTFEPPLESSGSRLSLVSQACL